MEKNCKSCSTVALLWIGVTEPLHWQSEAVLEKEVEWTSARLVVAVGDLFAARHGTRAHGAQAPMGVPFLVSRHSPLQFRARSVISMCAEQEQQEARFGLMLTPALIYDHGKTRQEIDHLILVSKPCTFM